MSLSFKDSLTNSITNSIATTAAVNSDNEIATVNAYSLRSAALLVDDGWTAIENQGYRFYDNEYNDESYSTVDELKNIILDSKQFNITQEQNSQYIPFQMPRYYDGFDLKNTKLSIYYVNENKDAHSDIPVDVYYNDEYIRFAWLVSEFATQVAGILQFEIHATGVNTKGEAYTWKSKSIDKLNVLQSLEDVAVGEIGVSEEELESWYNKIQLETQNAQIHAANAAASAKEAASLVAELKDGITDEVETAVDEKVESVVDGKITDKLTNYYTKAETYDRDEINEKINAVKPVGYATTEYVNSEITSINNKFGSLVDTDGAELTVEEYVKQEVDAVDVSDELGDLGTNEDGTKKTVVQYVADAIAAEDITTKLGNYYTKSETYNKSEVEALLDGVEVDLTGYATEKFVTDKTDVLSASINTNTEGISSLGTVVAELQETVNAVDTSPRLTYDIVYNDTDDENSGENVLVFYEIENEGKENEVKNPKKKYTITGGSGGSTTSNDLKIYFDKDQDGNNITQYVFTTENVKNNEAVIYYDFSGTDSVGDSISSASATWQLRRGTSGAFSTITKETVYPNTDIEFNASKYIPYVGTYQLKLIVDDESGGFASKTWTVQQIDFKIESDFDDKIKQPIGTVQFPYTPYGSIKKDVHFILYDENGDSEEIGKVTTSSSGIQLPFEIPAQEHGSRLLEVYMTAYINETFIESNHIFKDIIWFDDTSTKPIIGTIYQNFTAKQYETTNIEYSAYDPTTQTPTVEIAVDEVVVATKKLEKTTDTYSFKTDIIGKHTITITCGETVKTLIANIVDLGINVTPVTTGLVFDFNPVGKSNGNDADKKWSYNTVSMTVSDNFDWINGGYQYDENGDQYFCIKAGTSAEIDYRLFGDDAMVNGKEMKLVFKTTNVSKPNATFMHCIDNTTDSDYIGIQMDVHEAFICGQSKKTVEDALHLPYSEEDIIEFEFNISKKTEKVPMVMGYEDGVSTCPMVYDSSTHSFTQQTKKVISLGSKDCDLHIYRFKVYNTSLTDVNILNNFIADARNAEEMVSRYNRNQIYDENGNLDPDILAEKCPWLRIIKIEAPSFTTGKKYPVNNTTIEYIYKNGEKDGSIDYWKCENGVHVGQGTSSDNYGAAGRNLDLVLKSHKDFNNTPKITLKDGTEVTKVALTNSSVPVNYFNCKVNIASSENANNALLQRRYNTYNPYNRAFVREDGYDTSIIKDTMEFYNCVIFIKENSEDLTVHTEFADNEWHFYAIGNIGDSKKTDKTRLTDPDDRYECINEIIDVKYPLSDFPVGEEAIAIVEAEKFDKSGTYEWRYIWEDDEDEEASAEVFEYCKQRWIEFYKFVVNSTDEEFKAHLGDYFVLDSALYYYLFTTRYTMVDNRAKNSFWHYGKTGEVDSEGNPIRKWDLAFDYDNDTALGINNYGDMVYRYGLEDTHVDENGSEIFRESDSTFFCRLRDLFGDELKALYQTLETNGAWNSEGLIAQFDEWQNEFPEELWRKDIERKYIRTYTSSHINGAPWTDALEDMAHGRKKYQRRQYERNQEKYMASKYQSSVAASDENSIVIRCGEVPKDKIDSLVVKPNYSLTLTPYSYMYLNVEYANGVIQKPIEELGVPITLTFDGDSTDIIKIYSASSLQSIGDLSPCYARTISASNATKLKELIIGNGTDGYDNPYLENITTGANYLLEKLNIENVSGLTQALNLQVMNNLKELYAHGSNISGVTFADGGRIEIAELPAINTLTIKNLIYLVNLDIADLTKLTRLRVENCSTVDLISILNAASNLNRVRITGIDWTLENTSLLERLYLMSGEDKDGALTDANGNDYPSVLTGEVHVPTIKQKQLEDYNEKWPDLEIVYPEGGLIEQFAVTFVNADDTLLLNKDGMPMVQYVDVNGFAVDPSTYDSDGNPTFPTIESTVEYDYIFAKQWTLQSTGDIFDFNTPIRQPITLKAVYTSSRRTYEIKYVSKTQTITDSGLYGSNIVYDYEKFGIPYYTAQENANTFYLFSHWDKSGFLLEGENGTDLEGGVKIVNAIYDVFRYSESGSGLVEQNENPDVNGSYTIGNFKGLELKDLSPVHIYALTKLGVSNVPIGQLQDDGSYAGLKEGDPYTIVVGNDVDFTDIDSEVLISAKTTFGNSNYNDTNIQLFDTNKDFVLAIDYKFLGQKSGTLVQCLDSAGNGRGFKLWYDGSTVQFTYDEISESITNANNHEIIVIRNAKNESTGEYVLSLYQSNLDGDTVKVSEFNRNKVSDTNASLIFGASFAYGEYGNYVDGDISWAKIWLKDLGDDACRSLAMWTHEPIEMNVCGFKRYILTDNTKCSFSLLSSHLLEKTRIWNSPTNDYGWAGSDGLGNSLNKFLNSRLYNAIPIQIRYLLKPMIVWGNDGLGQRTVTENGANKTVYYTNVTSSNCYITIPAIVELCAVYQAQSIDYQKTAPYNLEIQNGNDDVTTKTIPYMVNDDARIRTFSDGRDGVYWTRSPDIRYQNYVWCIDENGKPKTISGTQPNINSNGILIEISF